MLTYLGLAAAVVVILMSLYAFFLMATQDHWKEHWHPWHRVVLYSSLGMMMLWATRVIWLR